MGVLGTLDQSGWNYSDYPTTLTYVKNIFTTIYGSDIYLDSDSQDGQLCGVLATAMYDNNQTFASIINALAPNYAQDVQLSNSVLINGITRTVATNSTAMVTCAGTVGTVLSGVSAKDSNGNTWNIASGVIGSGGTVSLLATCTTPGAISANANTITSINTPTLGWQSVTNPTGATIGTNVETDSALRQRQSLSVGLPSVTAIGGLLGAILAITGVTRAQVYENPTNSAVVSASNPWGLPANSVTAVVEGGDGQTIANNIALRKTIGCLTNGTSSYTTTDQNGQTMLTSFSVLGYTTLKLAISIHPLTGYVSTTVADIQNSIASYINGMVIGEDVFYSKLYAPAGLNNSAEGNTYNITSLQIGLLSGSLGVADIVVPYNQAPKILASNITVTIV